MLVKELLDKQSDFPHAVFVSEDYSCRGCAHASHSQGYLRELDGEERLLDEHGCKEVESFYYSIENENLIMWMHVEDN